MLYFKYNLDTFIKNYSVLVNMLRPTVNKYYSAREARHHTPGTTFNAERLTEVKPDSHVIIGDTSAAILFAQRLVSNKIPDTVYVLTQGIDRTTVSGLSDLTFPNVIVEDIRFRLLYRTEYEPAGDESDGSDGDNDNEKVGINQLSIYGGGPLGDGIVEPLVDMGPWVTQSKGKHLEAFINRTTIKIPYNTKELEVAGRIATAFGIPIVDGLVTVVRPSATNVHRYLIVEDQGRTFRNIFYGPYDIVLSQNGTGSTPKVILYPQTDNLVVTPNPSGAFCDVSGRTGDVPFTIPNARIYWKTYYPVYHTLASTAGLRPAATKTPTNYRAIIPISRSFVGTEKMYNGDTTHVTFSLHHNYASSRGATVSWMIAARTNDQDVKTGIHGDTLNNKTLLIVEALNVGNQRMMRFNSAERSVTINLNETKTEEAWMTEFKSVVNIIYQSYTGSTMVLTDLNVSAIAASSDICAAGTCLNIESFTSMPAAVTEPLYVINLLANLYQIDNYKAAGQGNP